MRLYPPAFAIVREAKIAGRIGDHAVPAGTVIMISPWVLHRHRRLWEAPNLFEPRRFLPGAPPVDRFAYLPFGIGPRVWTANRLTVDAKIALFCKPIERLQKHLHLVVCGGRRGVHVPAWIIEELHHIAVAAIRAGAQLVHARPHRRYVTNQVK